MNVSNAHASQQALQHLQTLRQNAAANGPAKAGGESGETSSQEAAEPRATQASEGELGGLGQHVNTHA